MVLQHIKHFTPSHLPRLTDMRLTHPEPIHCTALAIDALRRFRQEDHVLTLAVIDDAGKVVGCLSKQKTFALFGQQYAHDLYRRRSIELLIDRQCLIFDYQTSADIVSRAMTDRDDAHQLDPVLLLKNNRFFGFLSMIELLKQMTQSAISLAFDANPLSHLPGNNQINHEIDRRLHRQQDFVLVYIDLDHFKVFNDYYGYERGDRVIQLLADCLRKAQQDDDFIGHIGGDDFVMLLDLENWKSKTHDFIDDFSAQVLKLYDQEDQDKGYIYAENRQGELHRFELISLSLGAVVCPAGRYTSYTEVSTIASEVKHAAKKQSGHSLVIDRRQQQYADKN